MLNINMDAIKYGKRIATTRLMICQLFWKLRKNENFRGKLNIWKFKISKKKMMRNLLDEEALYESSVRKLGWRFTARSPNTESRWIGLTMDPRRCVILVDIFMFLVIFCITSYWFVALRSFLLYWSLIFREYQLSCSTKPLLTTLGRAHQNVEKSWFFRIFIKIRNKNPWIWKFTFEKLPMKEILRMNYKWGDLL